MFNNISELNRLLNYMLSAGHSFCYNLYFFRCKSTSKQVIRKGNSNWNVESRKEIITTSPQNLLSSLIKLLLVWTKMSCNLFGFISQSFGHFRQEVWASQPAHDPWNQPWLQQGQCEGTAGIFTRTGQDIPLPIIPLPLLWETLTDLCKLPLEDKINEFRLPQERSAKSLPQSKSQYWK